VACKLECGGGKGFVSVHGGGLVLFWGGGGEKQGQVACVNWRSRLAVERKMHACATVEQQDRRVGMNRRFAWQHAFSWSQAFVLVPLGKSVIFGILYIASVQVFVPCFLRFGMYIGAVAGVMRVEI
jgi:hypothetical protein